MYAIDRVGPHSLIRQCAYKVIAAVDRLTPGGDGYRADPDNCECSVPYFNIANACAYCGTGEQNRGTTKDDFFDKCEKNNVDVR